MADVDWGLYNPNTFDTGLKEGSDFVDKMMNLRAQTQAGQQYAGGDTQGAINTFANSGDIKSALALQQAQQQTAESKQKMTGEAFDQKVKQYQGQQTYLANATRLLSGILSDPKGGPDGVLQGFDLIKGEMAGWGFAPDSIAQMRQALQVNPKAALTAMGGVGTLTYHDAGDHISIRDPRGNEVGVIPKGDTPAEKRQAANQPFNPDGTPNTAVQKFKLDEASAAANARGEPLVPVQGADGKVTYALRDQAVGQQVGKVTTGGVPASQVIQRTFPDNKGLMWGITRTGATVPILDEAGNQITGAQYDPGNRFNLAQATAQGTIAGEAGKPALQADITLAEDRAKTQAAREKLKPKADTAMDMLTIQRGRINGAIDDLVGSIDPRTKKPVAGLLDTAVGGTGWLSGMAANVRGSQAYEINKVLNVIKTNAAFDTLQSLRDSSPTGGALGQISDQEEQMLREAQGVIEQGLQPAELKKYLLRFRTQMAQIDAARERAYQRDFGDIGAGKAFNPSDANPPVSNAPRGAGPAPVGGTATPPAAGAPKPKFTIEKVE